MDYLTYHTSKLYFSEFSVQFSRFNQSHHFEAESGNEGISFGFITDGTVVLNAIGHRIEVPSNSLFYIPAHTRYNSVWSGSPRIEFYGIHAIEKAYDPETASSYAIQYIPHFSTDETCATFRRIHDLMAKGDTASSILAIGLFYEFYAAVLPCLSVERPVRYSSTLVSALHYIENHCTEDFSVGQLAELCHISESRLYALFDRQLSTSPIRYRNELRVEKAARDLCSSDRSIDEISYQNGFNSPTYFRETFKQYTGLTPSNYRSSMHSRKYPLPAE